MKETRLSIIIPHFNIPGLLDRLLETVPVSEEIQLIVVDDNSTEARIELSEVIKRQSACRNISFLTNHTMKNSAGTCRNIGLEHADGEFVIFADADDMFLPGWYDAVSECFDTDNDIVYFLATSRYEETGETGTRHRLFRSYAENYLNDPNHRDELLLRYNYLAAGAVMYRRSFLNENALRFGTTLWAEDTLFIAQAGHAANRFAVANETVFCFSQRKGSLTTIRSREAMLQHMNTKVEKFAFMYSVLSPEEIPLVDLEYAGAKVLFHVAADGYGLKSFFEYGRLLREKNVPVINLRSFDLVHFLRRSYEGLSRTLTAGRTDDE